MQRTLVLLALVGFTPTVFLLKCKTCDSTVSWDDCRAKVSLEDCGKVEPEQSNHTHHCFQLEETDPVIFRQGCTGNASFCAERSQGNMKRCSLCTDDSESSECTSMTHHLEKRPDGKMVDVVDVIHIQRSESEPASTVEPPTGNSSSEVVSTGEQKNELDGLSSSSDGGNKTGVIDNSESSVELHAVQDGNNSTNESKDGDTTHASVSDISVEAAETTTTLSITDEHGPLIAIGPPEPMASGSYGSNRRVGAGHIGFVSFLSMMVYRKLF